MDNYKISNLLIGGDDKLILPTSIMAVDAIVDKYNKTLLNIENHMIHMYFVEHVQLTYNSNKVRSEYIDLLKKIYLRELGISSNFMFKYLDKSNVIHMCHMYLDHNLALLNNNKVCITRNFINMKSIVNKSEKRGDITALSFANDNIDLGLFDSNDRVITYSSTSNMELVDGKIVLSFILKPSTIHPSLPQLNFVLTSKESYDMDIFKAYYNYINKKCTKISDVEFDLIKVSLLNDFMVCKEDNIEFNTALIKFFDFYGVNLDAYKLIEKKSIDKLKDNLNTTFTLRSFMFNDVMGN